MTTLEAWRVRDPGLGRQDHPHNFRTVCCICYEGLQQLASPKLRRIDILRQVRRATIDDQLHLLDWLEKKYATIRPKRD